MFNNNKKKSFKDEKKYRSSSSLITAVVCRNDNLNQHNEATLSFFHLGWGSSCCSSNDRDHDGQRCFELMLFMWESQRTDNQPDVSHLRPVTNQHGSKSSTDPTISPSIVSLTYWSEINMRDVISNTVVSTTCRL